MHWMFVVLHYLQIAAGVSLIYSLLFSPRVLYTLADTVPSFHSRAADSTKLPELERELALKGRVQPRASHCGEIALAGSRRLRSTLVALPVLFAHAGFIVAIN